MHYLIPLKREKLLSNSFLGDNQNLQAITNMNMTLSSRRKGVLHKLESLFQCERWRVLNLLVLLVDLTIKEGHDQRSGRSSSSAELSLVRSDRVVRVDGTLALLIETSNDGVHVVREESLVVKHVLNSSGSRLHLEWLVVLEMVPFNVLLNLLHQGVTVS